MSEHELITNPGIDPIDPCEMKDATESGELERPRLRRKIDCAGNPEITDRRQVARGSNGSRHHR
jgi:hypothetical protein